MRITRLSIPLLFALAFALLAIPFTAASPPQVQTSHQWVTYFPLVSTSANTCPGNPQEQAIAYKMRSDPNQMRPSLTCNPILAFVAHAYAVDMATRNYYDHINPEGFGPNYRVRQAGYILPSNYYSDPTANNVESIAAGYTAPDDVWNGWMSSEAHRTHLLGLDPFFADQIDYGIGYAYSATSQWKHYWVVITAKPGP